MNFDFIKPIFDVFDKIFKGRLWIIPYISSAAFGFLWWIGLDNVWVKIICILSCFIAIAHLLWYLVSWIYHSIQRVRSSYAYQKQHKDNVWTLVKFFDKEENLLQALSVFLTLEKHSNKYIRCISLPSKDNPITPRQYDSLIEVAEMFGREYDYLITIKQVRGGTYFYFDEYFYDLIEHFQKKNRWEKI